MASAPYPNRRNAPLMAFSDMDQRIFDIINDAMPDRYKAKLTDRSYHADASRAGHTLREYLDDRKKPKNKRKWS